MEKLLDIKMKNILGLDLGTNSIGWALIKETSSEKKGEIIASGVRIIPMSQDILGKFDSGQSLSQTAERTGYRSIRRLRERHLLRRERLHRTLNILGFLPEHYVRHIDFQKRLGQFLPDTEPKLAYFFDKQQNRNDFFFKESFNEMLKDFRQHHPGLVEENKKIPYDWTIYYLRKKALTNKIAKEEIAWLLLNFNQKRGYNQLRDEGEEENKNKLVEFHSLRVTGVNATEERKTKDEIWYNVHLENGWIYRRTSKTPLDWHGKVKEFIVTTDLNDDGTVKKDKEGKEKRSFRAPDENDWTLVKKKTEYDIEKSQKTIGVYVYENLLQNSKLKINGKLLRVIERKYYKSELEAILNKQKEFHDELKNANLYQLCLEELYEHNEDHRNSIRQKGFTHLFLNDIIFYQRPLKSKKSLISNCKYESSTFIKNGKKETKPLKCIAKSHPLFQEFRLWQFIHNLKIYQREKDINGKLETDIDVTSEFIKSEEDWVNLFEWLNERKEIDQKAFLKYPGFKLKRNADNYRWNYVEDKTYPCNETRAKISVRLNKLEYLPLGFLNKATEESLWHILYSVEDKIDIQKALKTFSEKNGLKNDFVENFIKFPSFKKDYGSYSSKAIKKLLPLMRMGKYWNEKDINEPTKERINKIINGEYDETIRNRVRDKTVMLQSINDFKGLPVWLSSYIVYDRHSEDGEILKWKTADDIKLLVQHSLRNPIVEQVINETLQLVKDVWKQYGVGEEHFFHEVHIELGREMKNPADKRKQMTDKASENENTNLRIKALLSELLNDGNVENVRPYSPMQQEILKIYEEGALNTESDIPDDILKIAKQAQPTTSELIRYKLWLQQRYRSPYTGEIIPLNKLFTRAYDIEHIIPQSRYFDDSFSNKVICESVVNGEYYKSNRTGYEFIKEFNGKIVDEISTSNKVVKIFTVEQYEDFVKNNFSKNRGKLKRLLMEEIPESFIQRQLNDSRYISKIVKNLMSNIVRGEGEQEVISKNVIVTNGSITSTLKHDWGLNDIWNEVITPRFEELNRKTNSQNFGHINETTRKFLPQVPIELQKGFNKKRIDHRHHALDAIVVACTSRNHINYLNNESAIGKGKSKEEKEKKRYDLKHKLCFKKYNDNTEINYKWTFHKPWETFTQDAKEILFGMIVSFKQNLRVINKTTNRSLTWRKDDAGKFKKELVKQTKGENWAIRKPMHKDTVSGIIQLRVKKLVSLSSSLDSWKMIIDRNLRNQIKELTIKGYDKKQITGFFKEKDSKWNGKDISKVEIYVWDKENVASRVKVDESFDSSKIESITDSGIKKIMLKHIKKFNEEKDGKVVEHPELAFSSDGLDDMNKNLEHLNGGKSHQPIYKVRTYEPKGNKFRVGQTGNKKDKYVEAAKGTNLFFAVYKDENGKRNYDTVPLNIVIERQKQRLTPVPEINELGHQLLFHLSPNDLVYVPNLEDQENKSSLNFQALTKQQAGQVYKVVSFTGSRLYCIPHTVATPIVDKFEFTQLNKLEFTLEKFSIKEFCIPLKTDRLGKITAFMINYGKLPTGEDRL